jgi:serpin B
MVIILPPFEDGSLSETVARMTPEKVQGVMAEIKSGFYKAGNQTQHIPKFASEQSMDLAQTLGHLGLETLFDASRSNLTNFISEDSKNIERVTFNSARHKSFIEVNEEGSEAAAATALFGFRSARPLFHKEFIANHPFLFFIYDEQTDLILFFGVMQDPKTS